MGAEIEEKPAFNLGNASFWFTLMICAPLIHGSLFTLPSLCRFEAFTSHLNNTTCKFCLCRCQPVTSNNLAIIA
jgi:hypothetical protein